MPRRGCNTSTPKPLYMHTCNVDQLLETPDMGQNFVGLTPSSPLLLPLSSFTLPVSAANSSSTFSFAPTSSSFSIALPCIAVSAVFPSALFLSFLIILQPPRHPTQRSSHGPLAMMTRIAAVMKPTLALPLPVHPTAA